MNWWWRWWAKWAGAANKMYGPAITCHAEEIAGLGDRVPPKWKEVYWRHDGCCSWCGSMSVEQAIRLLTTPGTRYSGSDWKYGWPHKFYIHREGWKNSDDGPHKFYVTHLSDATHADFIQFCALSAKLLGVTFVRRMDGSLRYSAVCQGFQTWGTVGRPRPATLHQMEHDGDFGPAVRPDFADNAWWSRAGGGQVQ